MIRFSASALAVLSTAFSHVLHDLSYSVSERALFTTAAVLLSRYTKSHCVRWSSKRCANIPVSSHPALPPVLRMEQLLWLESLHASQGSVPYFPVLRIHPSTDSAKCLTPFVFNPEQFSNETVTENSIEVKRFSLETVRTF